MEEPEYGAIQRGMKSPSWIVNSAKRAQRSMAAWMEFGWAGSDPRHYGCAGSRGNFVRRSEGANFGGSEPWKRV